MMIGDEIKYKEYALNEQWKLVEKKNDKSYFLSGGVVQAIYPGGVMVSGTYQSGLAAREFVNKTDLICGAVKII